MKSLKKIFITVSATALMLGPVASLFYHPALAEAVEQNQVQSQGMAAVGASLSEDQIQETLNLLGASHVSPDKVKKIDGTIIHHYLQDDSDANSIVYSSAFIEAKPEGHGVQVQILTPQNILNVSQLTYQNAAITAGAKNALIKVASVSPVTGEGALAGVYALMADAGIEVKAKDAKVAQNEISLINQLGEKSGLNNTQMNQLIAELKIALINNKDIDLEATVDQILEAHGLVGNQEAKEKLLAFAKEFLETDAAKDQETVKQLEQSTIPVWFDALNQLDPNLTFEDFAARERLDLSDKEVMPEIKALVDRFYQEVDANQIVTQVYAYTFILETYYPDLTPEEMKALHDLRTEIFYYSAVAEASMGGTGQDLKDRWIYYLSNYKALKLYEPILAEIFNQVGVLTGLMPQAYDYQVTGQDNSLISLEITEDLADHVNTYLYKFDLADHSLMDATIEMLQAPLDLAAIFGNPIQDLRTNRLEIPGDYLVPETYNTMTDQEESSETESLEETENTEILEELPESEEISEPVIEEEMNMEEGNPEENLDEIIEEPVVEEDPAA